MNHEIIPILNKIDLPASDLDRTSKQIEDVIGIDTNNAIPCSGKTGEGIDDILEAIVNNLPAPKGDKNNKLKCLLVLSKSDAGKSILFNIGTISWFISSAWYTLANVWASTPWVLSTINIEPSQA